MLMLTYRSVTIQRFAFEHKSNSFFFFVIGRNYGWCITVSRQTSFSTKVRVYLSSLLFFNLPIFGCRNLPAFVRDVPPDVSSQDGLEIKVCVRTYRLFYVSFTEDFMWKYRSKEEMEKNARLLSKRNALRREWLMAVNNSSGSWLLTGSSRYIFYLALLLYILFVRLFFYVRVGLFVVLKIKRLSVVSQEFFFFTFLIMFLLLPQECDCDYPCNIVISNRQCSKKKNRSVHLTWKWCKIIGGSDIELHWVFYSFWIVLMLALAVVTTSNTSNSSIYWYIRKYFTAVLISVDVFKISHCVPLSPKISIGSGWWRQYS